jgi:hypothetical protein
MGENGLPRTFVVGSDDFKRLSLRDLITASEVAGVDVTDLGNLRGVARIKGLAGMAFVIARRDDPELTFEQVLDGRVESPGEEAPPLASVTPS